MSIKRMFSKNIVDLDAFMDMPQSSQLLYFHLCMRADDEVIVKRPCSAVEVAEQEGGDDFSHRLARYAYTS